MIVFFFVSFFFPLSLSFLSFFLLSLSFFSFFLSSFSLSFFLSLPFFFFLSLFSDSHQLLNVNKTGKKI